MIRIRQIAQVFVGLLFCTTPALLAQGEGGIVVVDSAPVFVHSTGDSVEGSMSKTFRIAGVTSHGLGREEYRFEPKDGRVHVQYSDNQGLLHTAWMRPTDLETFTYECSCGKGCTPWEFSGLKARFNKCFLSGSAQAVARLMPTPRPTAAPAAAVAEKPEQGAKALTNGDVVALVKAGLDDGIVIAKIEAAPAEGLDVSTEALVRLKKQGVSGKVIQVMVKQAGGGNRAGGNALGSPAAATASGPAVSSTKELNRSTAAGLLRGSVYFQTPGCEQVVLGMDFRTADFMGVGNWDVADILLEKGYLQRRGNEIALTAKGEAATRDSPRDPEREKNRLFPVAKREVLEVTGIAEVPMMGASVKEVQLTWRWSLTELGAEMAKASDRLARKYSPSQVRQASALVRHYDDGWRIEKVDGLF